jgi:hypothetical protein
MRVQQVQVEVIRQIRQDAVGRLGRSRGMHVEVQPVQVEVKRQIHNDAVGRRGRFRRCTSMPSAGSTTTQSGVVGT